MQSVTSNAVAESEGDLKVKWVNIQGQTDGLGNFPVTLPSGTVAVCYAGNSVSGDTNYNMFFSTTQLKWYVHSSNFSTGAGIAGATINGRVYYVKYFD